MGPDTWPAPSDGTALPTRIAAIRAELARACERAGRSPTEVTLMGASKGRPAREILDAWHAGLDRVGENTVQEALTKAEFLPSELPLELIGTLQPNKARTAVRLFDRIQSVTSRDLVDTIDRHARELDRAPYPVLIETTPTPQTGKRGLSLPEAQELAIEIATRRDGVRLEGLMAMMPYTDEPERLRPDFRAVSQVFRELVETHDLDLTTLSMGMSTDYPVAIEEGATLVRVGTALFGPRRPR